MSFHLGTTVGDYEIIDILESSSAATTYRVRNRLERRFEAMRVLSRGGQDDAERLERFVREMKVHGRLAHPNIVTFYGAAHLEGYAVMTTEVLEGCTLEQQLEAGPLPVTEALRIISDVLSALECAHRQGIVHREIAPKNIFLTTDQTVKVTGFGLAKSAADPQFTQVGAAVGSVWYMSPEQVKGVETPGPATDIYSAGVLLYQLLTGVRPFESQSQFEVMTAHVMSTPEPPSKKENSLPPELDAVILKALAKSPAGRYTSAEAFRCAIIDPGSAAMGPSQPALAAASVEIPATPPAAPSPQSIVAQATVGAVLILVVSVVWFLVLTR